MDNYTTKNKIALFGPYVGDWKEEILSFRPFIKWIYDNIEFQKYYISSHINRSFMYDFIDKNNYLPVYESLTRDEIKQKNTIHKDIYTKEYSSIILRNIRDSISKNEDVLKKNIIQYGLSYIKAKPNFSICNKSFSMISYDKDKNKEKIVIIPDRQENKKLLGVIINHLEKKYPNDFVVIGDKKTHFKDMNIIRQRIDYFEMVYKMTIDYISNAKMVICPCSHWTVLANQQNTYVLSWGYDNIAQYKTGGIYGLNNNNSIIEIKRELIKEKILNQIDYEIEKIL